MLAVTACYTFTTLNDKHALSKEKLSSSLYTFLMCSSMAVFLLPCLFFVDVRFDFSPEAFLGVLLMIGCKCAELFMCAAILRVMSAFELKAWIGVTLFFSYATDVLLGAELTLVCVLFILITVAGLALIVRADKKEKVPYKKIALPLVLFLASKYGYGLVIRTFSSHASSSMLLLISLSVISIILLPTIKISEIKEKKRGSMMVALARIPNTAGMLAENTVATVSLTSYSFIQPMILCTLFFIRIIKKEDHTPINVVGGIMCIVGLIGFQLFK